MKNIIKENAKSVIELQIKALKKLKNSLDESFIDAVKAIIKCKSKVIICGVGKSGRIASKISATLSSTGTPSFCVSANDCSHGDLGRITKNDIVILISNSGDTEELRDILKHAKNLKIRIIGIVSKKNSYLYRSANIKILLPDVIEAGYGIVPTSSTTTQLALGDALAISLMKEKNFNRLDFKKFHPSGNLAKKLKTASDIMLTGNRIPFVNENMLMKDCLKVLNSKKQGFLVINNNLEHTTGVFTDGDLKRLIQKKKNFHNFKIKNFITRNPYIVKSDMLATDILFQMNKRKITNICVANSLNIKKTIGIIHIHSLIKLIK